MYIVVGNNHAFTLKDADLMDSIQDFFAEIKLDVTKIEKVLGKIGFEFSRNIENDTIVVWIVNSGHGLKSAVLTFAEIKERFVRFAGALTKEINSADSLFSLFEKHFRSV